MDKDKGGAGCKAGVWNVGQSVGMGETDDERKESKKEEYKSMKIKILIKMV